VKIFIIDDSRDALEIVKKRLKNECHDTLCAEGGKLGLKMAKQELPDVILLDIDMPDISGFDICSIMKSDPELCMIPILFLSGSVSLEVKIKGLDLGGVDYITKPFDAFKLQARVRAALRTKHLQDLLINFAHLNPVTGLPNRQAMMERLQQEWTRMERHGHTFSFIMADIDHFKEVNDRYVHVVGDQLLQEVATVIARECRSIDLPVRYGGEEFAIIVPEENAANTLILAERCRKEIEKISLPVKKENISATVSFGIAEATGLQSLETLIEHADDALYEAKFSGRNKVASYESQEEVAT
jgi:two-component system, cell cycle response regulator